jgi:putative endonuclease
MNKQAFVYILASQRNGTLYTGVTSNLSQRLYRHKTKAHAESFTAKYAVDKLVWYVAGDDVAAAIELEKKIKNRNRAWKIALIEKSNPAWRDLSLDFMDSATGARNDGGVGGVRNDGGESSCCIPLCHAARSCSIQQLDSATGARNDGGVGGVRNEGGGNDVQIEKDTA